MIKFIIAAMPVLIDLYFLYRKHGNKAIDYFKGVMIDVKQRNTIELTHKLSDAIHRLRDKQG